MAANTGASYEAVEMAFDYANALEGLLSDMTAASSKRKATTNLRR